MAVRAHSSWHRSPPSISDVIEYQLKQPGKRLAFRTVMKAGEHVAGVGESKARDAHLGRVRQWVHFGDTQGIRFEVKAHQLISAGIVNGQHIRVATHANLTGV